MQKAEPPSVDKGTLRAKRWNVRKCEILELDF